MAGLCICADARAVVDATGYRSFVAASVDLASGSAEHVGTRGGNRIDQASDGPQLVMVADGAPCSYPGQLHPFGVDASYLALDAIRASLRARPRPEGSSADWLRDVVVEASLRAHGVSSGSLRSAIAVVLLDRGSAWVLHSGDAVVSVARIAESYRLVELTADHTLRREMLESGRHEELLALEGIVPVDNVMTRWFGDGGSPEPEVREIELAVGDRLVLAPRPVMNLGSTDTLGDLGTRARLEEWHRLWFEEALRREIGKTALLFAERRAP